MQRVLLAVLAVGGFASTREDYEHMGRCMPAVRNFVSAGDDSFDLLLKQANDDIDVVLLYLLRKCYFHHSRDSDNLYDMGKLQRGLIVEVASFTDYEFSLLTEALRAEQRDSSLYTQTIDWGAVNDDPPSPRWPYYLALGGVLSWIPLYVLSQRKLKSY